MSIIYTCVYTHTHKHKYNLLNLYVVCVCFHGWRLLLIIIIMIFTNKYTLTHIIYMLFFLSVHLLMTTILIIILCVNKKSNRKIHVCLYTLEAQTSMIHMNTKLALSLFFLSTLLKKCGFHIQKWFTASTGSLNLDHQMRFPDSTEKRRAN